MKYCKDAFGSRILEGSTRQWDRCWVLHCVQIVSSAIRIMLLVLPALPAPWKKSWSHRDACLLSTSHASLILCHHFLCTVIKARGYSYIHHNKPRLQDNSDRNISYWVVKESCASMEVFLNLIGTALRTWANHAYQLIHPNLQDAEDMKKTSAQYKIAPGKKLVAHQPACYSSCMAWLIATSFTRESEQFALKDVKSRTTACYIVSWVYNSFLCFPSVSHATNLETCRTKINVSMVSKRFVLRHRWEQEKDFSKKKDKALDIDSSILICLKK